MTTQVVLKVLLAGAMGGTVVVLILGLLSFSKGAASAGPYRNKLMQGRVLLQGVALLLFALLLLMRGH